MLAIKIELPDHFLDEEERCGYTVPSTIKKVWAVNLDLLHEFQRVCDRYHLQYYAAAGTLLGAVRHQGFIPWDDDIDVVMFRKDYDKLVSIAQQEFEPPYCFQTTNMADDFFRGHAQLRNSETTAIMKSQMESGYPYNQGIFMDIFVFDGIPQNKLSSWIQYKRLSVYNKILRNKATRAPKSLKGKMLHRIIKPLDKAVLDFQKMFYHYEALARKMSSKATEYVATLEYTAPPRYMFKVSDYEKTIDLPFEFLSIKAPQNYDSVLRAQYGDYLKPVMGDSDHGDVLFDPERPYTEYIHL